MELLTCEVQETYNCGRPYAHRIASYCKHRDSDDSPMMNATIQKVLQRLEVLKELRVPPDVVAAYPVLINDGEGGCHVTVNLRSELDVFPIHEHLTAMSLRRRDILEQTDLWWTSHPLWFACKWGNRVFLFKKSWYCSSISISLDLTGWWNLPGKVKFVRYIILLNGYNFFYYRSNIKTFVWIIII